MNNKSTARYQNEIKCNSLILAANKNFYLKTNFKWCPFKILKVQDYSPFTQKAINSLGTFPISSDRW